MKGQQSTRHVGRDQYTAPRNRGFSDSFATETLIVRGRHWTVGPHPRKLFRAILDPLRCVLDRLIGARRIRLGISPSQEHPGWNIEDQVDLEPHGEGRYLVDFVCGQVVTIALASRHPVGLAVLDDDEYESRKNDQLWPSYCRPTSGNLWDRGTNRVSFLTARTGLYDIIVINLGDQHARVLVRITAVPVLQVVSKGSGAKTGGTVTLPSRDARAI
jgi:hypothetical protein